MEMITLFEWRPGRVALREEGCVLKLKRGHGEYLVVGPFRGDRSNRIGLAGLGHSLPVRAQGR
jgi:hypothetical protein